MRDCKSEEGGNKERGENNKRREEDIQQARWREKRERERESREGLFKRREERIEKTNIKDSHSPSLLTSFDFSPIREIKLLFFSRAQ